MGEHTKIAWCDHTFNPWIGCTEVSPACDHCYARIMMQDRYHRVEWGNRPRVRTGAENWRKPLYWNANARRDGVRRKVFCASLSDILDNQVPIAWFADAMNIVRVTPYLDWLLLSKRIQNLLKRLAEARGAATDPDLGAWLGRWHNGQAPANVWLGSTAENQEEAERRIPLLRALPTAKRFLSCEPLLGALRLDHLGSGIGDARRYGSCLQWRNFNPDTGLVDELVPIDWVIAGGESGPNARPSHPDWFRSLRDQCAVAQVPFFFKQHGDWCDYGQTTERANEWVRASDGPPARGKLFRVEKGNPPIRHACFGDRAFDTEMPFPMWPNPGPIMVRVGKERSGALLDGVAHAAFPA